MNSSINLSASEKSSQSPFDVYLGRAISITRCSETKSVEEIATQCAIAHERLLQIERGSVSVTINELIDIATRLNSDAATVISIAEKLSKKVHKSD